MTKKEIIEALEPFPKNSEIYVRAGQDSHNNPCFHEVMAVEKFPIPKNIEISPRIAVLITRKLG